MEQIVNKNPPPYLSIVVPARNDGYGGDQQRRLEISCLGMLEQFERFNLDSEIILVDWNPPSDRPPLAELISWPSNHPCCSIRAITVAPKYHQRFLHHDKRPFAGAAASNTGIRRARGEYVVLKASDVFYSDELVAFFAQRQLNSTFRYRTNRCDVAEQVMDAEYDTLAKRLAFCKEHVLVEYGYQPMPAPVPILHTDACGDFQLLHRSHWHTLHGFWERGVISAHCDALLSYTSLKLGIREAILQHPARVYKITHPHQFTKTNKETASSAVRSGVPVLSWAECWQLIEQILQNKLSPILNDDNWGLGGEDLPERYICRALWD